MKQTENEGSDPIVSSSIIKYQEIVDILLVTDTISIHRRKWYLKTNMIPIKSILAICLYFRYIKFMSSLCIDSFFNMCLVLSVKFHTTLSSDIFSVVINFITALLW